MKRMIILAALAALAGLPAISAAQATPLSAKDREALRVHGKRDLHRYQQRRYQPQAAPAEGQRSRPIPPTSPNSQVVPNR